MKQTSWSGGGETDKLVGGFSLSETDKLVRWVYLLVKQTTWSGRLSLSETDKLVWWVYLLVKQTSWSGGFIS